MYTCYVCFATCALLCSYLATHTLPYSSRAHASQGDGLVGKEEMSKALKHVGHEASAADLSALFAQLDLDESGRNCAENQTLASHTLCSMLLAPCYSLWSLLLIACTSPLLFTIILSPSRPLVRAQVLTTESYMRRCESRASCPLTSHRIRQRKLRG